MSLIMLLGSVTIGNAWWWDECKTKYPIVLHGAFFRDKNMLGINYWWGIDNTLRQRR